MKKSKSVIKKKKLKKLPVPPADKDELLTRKNIKMMKKGGFEFAKPPLQFHENSDYGSSPYKLNEINDISPEKAKNTLSPSRSSPMKRHRSGSSQMFNNISSEGGTNSNFSAQRNFKMPRYQIPTSAKKKRATSAFSPF